ncbi:anthranilate synthase component I family protein [Bacillus sp. FJAT-42376]|uniref:anthranilate synthase component I family protein n=1 Tax=Bacillus sp. FJAT-42376 TaxID=2014076 RepID=UPI000F4D4D7E|nr:anthranilate synthase component I family protein [Bacillus sp. FJAT-42376]AZB41211.1 anthranilate synthase component I family protein [Bacillus sp. FJAT-42376]
MPNKTYYPFYKKMKWTADFFQTYKILSEGEPYHALLESGRGGRYTIAGLRPDTVITAKGREIEMVEGEEHRTFCAEHPLEWLQQWMSSVTAEKNPELPDFQSGAIGFISYDAVRHFEKLPVHSENDLDTPDFLWMIFHEAAILDHHTNEIYFIVLEDRSAPELARTKLEKWEQRWLHPVSRGHRAVYPLKEAEVKMHFTPEQFKDAVQKIKEYIAAGDVFQVNLSMRQGVKLENHPLDIYERLKEINPSPYMAYLETPDFQIVSGSPELLVKKSGRLLSTRPIAGTRSRGRDDEEDMQLAKELIDNEKERAEHVMLVDLERNDLGRVSKYGTVEVNEFMAIERYSHVMHIVSNVQGELEDGKNFSDIIRAVFPGGTITGAPKVRTMEIIEELEPKRRGIYTGSIGWIDFNGDLELNIVIRTLFAKDGAGYIQAGAGIVIDSNPDYEYKESLKKAAAVLKAAEQSRALS